MAKKRLYEIARELDLESRDVLERALELGLEVKTASSGLEEDDAALLALSFQEAKEQAAPVPSKPEPKGPAAVDSKPAPAKKPETPEAEVADEPEEVPGPAADEPDQVPGGAV